MATKPKQKTQNTSAPTVPGNSADRSATEAAQVAPQANLPAAGQSTRENQVASPEGAVAPLEDVEITSLLVTSEVDGFRRAGRAWSSTPTLVLLEDLSETEIDALLGEPLLKVAFVGANAEKIAD